MAGDWKLERISSVANVTDFVANGSFEALRNNVNYTSTPDYAVLVRLVDHNSAWNGNFVYVNKSSFDFLKKSVVRPGDIVIANVGANAGTVFRAPALQKPMTLGPNAILCRPIEDILDRDFLFYYLTGRDGQDSIASILGGSAQPKFNKTDFRTLQVPVPPLAEQKAIATVLRALDEKIELNRRMNVTLEAMARALFQSWFVDFDPVRAKLDRRAPAALDAATAAIFPATFNETNAGHIPHGWRVESIYEIANVIYGAPFASSFFNSEGRGKPLVRIRDLPNERPAVYTTETHPKGYLLRPGDIAVGMDGEFRAYVWAGVESWLNQRVCVFVPKPGYSAAFVRHSIAAPLAQVEATETATTVIHLGKNDVDRFTAIIPDSPVAEAFKRQCQPWYDRIVANKQQSRTLTTLRDTLLPKLMSGELKAVG
jgi:type I restriction enzyme S subunit